MTHLGRFVTLTSGDLRSKLQIYLSRSKRISVDPAWWEEHSDVKIIPLTYVVQKLLIKNVSLKNVILTFDDLWCTHYWWERQSEGNNW